MKHRKSIELVGGGAGSEGTLGELAEWYELLASCRACQHVKHIDRYALARRFGKSMRIAGIGSQLRCQKCGNREGNRVLIGMMPRD